MTSKKFILFTLTISFILLCLIPYFNYITDQYRVLHNDYENYYTEVNKNYLKNALFIK